MIFSNLLIIFHLIELLILVHSIALNRLLLLRCHYPACIHRLHCYFSLSGKHTLFAHQHNRWISIFLCSAHKNIIDELQLKKGLCSNKFSIIIRPNEYVLLMIGFAVLFVCCWKGVNKPLLFSTITSQPARAVIIVTKRSSK